MPSTIMKKDKRYRLVIAVEALLITLLFHLVLLFGFRQDGEKPMEETAVYRRISMLPAGGRGEMTYAHLAAWLEYNDPTMIAKPNERYGYSGLTALHGWRDNRIVVGPEAEARQPDFVLPLRRKAEADHAGLTMNDWLAAYCNAPGRTAVTPVSLPFPRVFNSSGKELWRGIFDGSEAELSREINRLPPVGGTVLELGNGSSDRLPRYQIRSSCGNRQLDLLALRKVMSRGEKISEDILTVDWPSAAEVKK